MFLFYSLPICTLHVSARISHLQVYSPYGFVIYWHLAVTLLSIAVLITFVSSLVYIICFRILVSKSGSILFRSQWNHAHVSVRSGEQSLKRAMSAVTSGTPLPSGSRIHGVPCRTLRDYVSQEKSPLKKVGCLTKKPGLTLRKEEDLSYGRLIRFSRDSIDDFSKLLRQTLTGMKLHQWPCGRGRT
jgi:hypothetical protein